LPREALRSAASDPLASEGEEEKEKVERTMQSGEDASPMLA